MKLKRDQFTTGDLATYFNCSRGTFIAYAEELGFARWNRKRTRLLPFSREEARALVARKLVGRI